MVLSAGRISGELLVSSTEFSGTQRNWIQTVKKGSSRETDTPTSKKWEQRRSGFFHGLLYIWTTSVREGPFSSINYFPKRPHVPTQAPVSPLIPNQIKLAIWTITSSPLLKFTVKDIPISPPILWVCGTLLIQDVFSSASRFQLSLTALVLHKGETACSVLKLRQPLQRQVL